MMCGSSYLRAHRTTGLVVKSHRRPSLAAGRKSPSSSRMGGRKMPRQGVPGALFSAGCIGVSSSCPNSRTCSFAFFKSQLKCSLPSLLPPRLPSLFSPLSLVCIYSILIIFNYNTDSSITKLALCTTQFIHIFTYPIIHS